MKVTNATAVAPTRNISADEIRKFEKYRLWRRLRHLNINVPLSKQVKNPPHHYHLDSLTHDGGIRIETNFKMRG